MKPIKKIEIWFTTNRGREYEDCENLIDAKKAWKRLEKSGMTELVIDVYYYENINGDAGDVIEDMVKHYTLRNNKLVNPFKGLL